LALSERAHFMTLKVASEVRSRFPGLQVLAADIRNVKVVRESAELEKFKVSMLAEVEKRYDLQSLKDVAVFRAYRDFFWREGLDPTKVRPAAEALIRRILRGSPLPNINSLVDAYNLASIKTEIALAAFDEDKLKGELVMRFAANGEKFRGIGMQEPKELGGGEIVISDAEKLVAIYPHRDAEETKVTEETRNVLLLVCGVPGIKEKILAEAEKVAVDYVVRFCDGREFTSKSTG